MRRFGGDWRFDTMVFLGLGAVITILFDCTQIDMAAAELFYSPQSPNPWPLGWHGLLSLPHGMAPWITTTLVLVGLAALAVGVRRRNDTWRRTAIFILLSVAIGPGLIVNSVFKEHWGRPRPRDILEFGGRKQFAPAPFRGEGGKSFPCGDSSVGFLFALGWWVWRRDRPRRAAASLAMGIATGAAVGLGRMAAGGHFLSDVVWSAFLSLAVAHVLYSYVLRIPAREAPLLFRPIPKNEGESDWWMRRTI
ncbi:phosphatase PAP2 family protein [bacterium]|nr:phosphatase PAP2 family protein [bacterium]